MRAARYVQGGATDEVEMTNITEMRSVGNLYPRKWLKTDKDESAKDELGLIEVAP